MQRKRYVGANDISEKIEELTSAASQYQGIPIDECHK